MTNIVSVVVVNWNGSKWIDKCVESLILQTSISLEIIFVDNASTDDSLPRLRKYHDKIKIIQNNINFGYATAVNIGIKNSIGDWVVLLNNDAWLDPASIHKLYKEAHSKGIDIIGAREVGYFDDNSINHGNMTIDFLGYPIQSKDVKNCPVFYFSAVCIGFSKKFYEMTFGLDDDFFMYFEETDWFWRCHQFGCHIGISDNVTVHHAVHGSTNSESNFNYNRSLWRNQNNLQMLLVNHRLKLLVFVLPIYFITNICEFLFFICIGKFNIAYTYIKGLTFNAINIKRIVNKRSKYKLFRSNGAICAESLMFRGFSKLDHIFKKIDI